MRDQYQHAAITPVHDITLGVLAVCILDLAGLDDHSRSADELVSTGQIVFGACGTKRNRYKYQRNDNIAHRNLHHHAGEWPRYRSGSSRALCWVTGLPMCDGTLRLTARDTRRLIDNPCAAAVTLAVEPSTFAWG